MGEINVPEAAKKIAGYVVFGAIVLNAIDALSRFRAVEETDKVRLIYNRIKENLMLKEETNGSR